MLLSPTTRLSPYEIVSSIGAGRMDEVYRGRDTRLDRTVAIKILQEHLLSKQGLERFAIHSRTMVDPALSKARGNPASSILVPDGGSLRRMAGSTSTLVQVFLFLVLQATLPAHAAAVASRNTSPSVRYVGSKLCAGCHSKIYNDYIASPMGRSASLAAAPVQFAKVQVPILVRTPLGDRGYKVYRQGSNLYQSECTLDTRGVVLGERAYKIEYVVGSGVNGYGYIARRGNLLVEAPLAFYTKGQTWGFSPGYEEAQLGFDRPIVPGCIVCHTGRPHVDAEHPGVYKEPLFLELAIGCENCHGPGELHVAERGKRMPLPYEGDTAIVNPAKLSPRLAEEICMYCHQSGEHALRAGKSYLDFRPGLPLSHIFAPSTPETVDANPESDLLSHHSSMMMSRCFRESAGRLSCLTCHNPHVTVAADSAADYRAKCFTCHTDASCKVPLRRRLDLTNPDNCVECHMPKRAVQEIPHAALTNHRIVIRP